jgi:hypothetical protein
MSLYGSYIGTFSFLYPWSGITDPFTQQNKKWRESARQNLISKKYLSRFDLTTIFYASEDDTTGPSHQGQKSMVYSRGRGACYGAENKLK